jgi:hypothetical protein
MNSRLLPWPILLMFGGIALFAVWLMRSPAFVLRAVGLLLLAGLVAMFWFNLSHRRRT